jgi:hypothetical protein
MSIGNPKSEAAKSGRRPKSKIRIGTRFVVPMRGLRIEALQDTPKDLGRTKIVRTASEAVEVCEALGLVTLLRLVCDTAALRLLRGAGFYGA